MLLIVILILLSFSCTVDSQDNQEIKLLDQFHRITSEEMMTWMEKLCSPEFRGRLSGTPEYIASAEWVAGKLKEWGVKPAGPDGTYFQWFDHPYTRVNDIGSLSMNINLPDGSVIPKNRIFPTNIIPG